MTSTGNINVLKSCLRPFRLSPPLSRIPRPYPCLPRTLQPAHLQLGRRYAHSIPKPPGARPATSPDAEAQGQDQEQAKTRKQLEPHYELTFTCVPCGSRSSHTISKQGYHKGSVLISCPSCRNRHIISDHLNIFGERHITVEDLMEERGQLVKRGTLGEDGDVEFWDDGTVTERAKSAGASTAATTHATEPTRAATPAGGLVGSGTRPQLDQSAASHQEDTPSSRRRYSQRAKRVPENIDWDAHIREVQDFIANGKSPAPAKDPLSDKRIKDSIGAGHPRQGKHMVLQRPRTVYRRSLGFAKFLLRNGLTAKGVRIADIPRSPQRGFLPDAIATSYPDLFGTKHPAANMPAALRKKDAIESGPTPYARSTMEEQTSRAFRYTYKDAPGLYIARLRIERGEPRSMARKDPDAHPALLKAKAMSKPKEMSKAKEKTPRMESLEAASMENKLSRRARRVAYYNKVAAHTAPGVTTGRGRHRKFAAGKRSLIFQYVKARASRRNAWRFVKADDRAPPAEKPLAASDTESASRRGEVARLKQAAAEVKPGLRLKPLIRMSKYITVRPRTWVYAWPEGSSLPIRVEVRRKSEQQTIWEKRVAKWGIPRA